MTDDKVSYRFQQMWALLTTYHREENPQQKEAYKGGFLSLNLATTTDPLIAKRLLAIVNQPPQSGRIA